MSLTSGDMARMLHVDLKTIHNWVKHGHVFGRRTRGRHLRFERPEVVRFLRSFGYPVPSDLGAGRARAVVNRSSRSRRPWPRRSSAGQVDWTRSEGLLDAAIEVAGGGHEVLAVDLDGYSRAVFTELVTTLRRSPRTRSIGLIGISRHPATRRAFVQQGGDIALPSGDGARLNAAVRWLVGAASSPPAGAQVE